MNRSSCVGRVCGRLWEFGSAGALASCSRRNRRGPTHTRLQTRQRLSSLAVAGIMNDLGFRGCNVCESQTLMHGASKWCIRAGCPMDLWAGGGSLGELVHGRCLLLVIGAVNHAGCCSNCCAVTVRSLREWTTGIHLGLPALCGLPVWAAKG